MVGAKHLIVRYILVWKDWFSSWHYDWFLKKRQVQIGFNSIVTLKWELTDYHWYEKYVSSIRAQSTFGA